MIASLPFKELDIQLTNKKGGSFNSVRTPTGEIKMSWHLSNHCRAVAFVRGEDSR